MFHKFGYRSQRFFQKGGFKYLILGLLKEKPRYGYEIIRELEERFHGVYAPSPGIVYPNLQMLEEMGYVTGSQEDGKRVYTITEAGLAFLAEREPEAEEAKRQMDKCRNPDIREQLHQTMHDLWELGKLIGRRAYSADADKIKQVREVIARAYKDVDAIFSKE